MINLFSRKKKNPPVRIEGTDCEIGIELPGKVTVRLKPSNREFFERADSRRINRHLVKKKLKFSTETMMTKVGNVSVVTAFVIDVPVEQILRTEVIKKIV